MHHLHTAAQRVVRTGGKSQAGRAVEPLQEHSSRSAERRTRPFSATSQRVRALEIFQTVNAVISDCQRKDDYSLSASRAKKDELIELIIITNYTIFNSTIQTS